MAVSSVLSGRERSRDKALKLDVLVNDLRSISPAWFRFGLQLRIEYHKLENIESDKRTVELCFYELLNIWLKNDANPSMATVVSALQNIGEEVLALELRQKYNVSAEPALPNNEGVSDLFAVSRHLLNPTKRSKYKVEIECRVSEFNQKAKLQYQRFVLHLMGLLKKHTVSVDMLLLAWSTAEGEISDKMRNANTHEQFMIAVSGSKSWYDYSTLASIARELCGDEGSGLVASYETALTPIVTNNLKKCRKTARMVMKVNQEWGPRSDNDVATFRNTIARLVKCQPNEFPIKDVRKGCIEITFVFSGYLCTHLKRVIKQNDSLFQEMKVTELWIETDGTIVWRYDCLTRSEEDAGMPSAEAKVAPQASSWLSSSKRDHAPHCPPARHQGVPSVETERQAFNWRKLIITLCIGVILILSLAVGCAVNNFLKKVPPLKSSETPRIHSNIEAVEGIHSNIEALKAPRPNTSSSSYMLIFFGLLCVCILICLYWRRTCRRKFYSLRYS